MERVSGTAWTIESTEKRNALAPGMLVPEGLTIATAPSGRVRLSSENNVMTLGPGSVAVVRPKGLLSSKTEVLQRVGSIEFDVEKRSAPHFTVQTPYMAAVVKGTAFTVNVSRTDTTIAVDRGLVQVQDLRTGETAGVGAGQGASVSSTDLGLRTAGVEAPDVTPGRPAAPSVAPAGQTLGSFREAQAADAPQTSGRSASPSSAASTNDGPSADARSAGDSGFGGFGGDDNGRDRPSLGDTAADTRTASSDTPRTAAGQGPQESDGPRADAGPGPQGSGEGNDTGSGGNGPGGGPGGGNGNGNSGNGHGNGGPGAGGDDGSNGGGNNGNGGPKGGDGGGGNGGGNGQGNNGNGHGNGGPGGNGNSGPKGGDDDDGGNGGGNGRGNNGNGNGNGGPSGNGNSGNGNNGNGGKGNG